MTLVATDSRPIRSTAARMAAPRPSLAEWLLRSPANQGEFQKYAKLPLVPLVVTPEGEGVQDSTPILERFEKAHPEPSIVPADPALAFISALLEEYGDEWGNKWMFHYRWRYQPDTWATAERIALFINQTSHSTRRNPRNSRWCRVLLRFAAIGCTSPAGRCGRRNRF